MQNDTQKPIYIVCPRCELNYIDSREKYCDVCKAELGLLDASILIPEDEEELGLEKLCPVCKVNYIGEDEDMCFLCQKERAALEIEEDDDNWMKLLDEEDSLPPDEISLELVAEEEEEDLDEEDGYPQANDFDYEVDPSDFEDKDYDDEDEDYDDFEEEEDDDEEEEDF